MDLRKLRHAVILASEGSFTRASNVLNLTQSALSRSIQSLEADLGQSLFERHGNGVRPTKAGNAILQHAERVLRDARELEREARRLLTGESGRVAFGVGPMLAPLLAPVLAETCRNAPALEIRTEIAPIPTLIERLFAEELELFVADTRLSHRHADLAIEPIARLGVGFFVRAGHPLAERRSVNAADLGNYPLASPHIGPPIVENEPGLTEQINWTGRCYCEDAATLKKVALASDAVMFGMGPALQPELAEGNLRPLSIAGVPPMQSTVGIVRLAARKISVAAQKVVEAMRTELLKL